MGPGDSTGKRDDEASIENGLLNFTGTTRRLSPAESPEYALRMHLRSLLSGVRSAIAAHYASLRRLAQVWQSERCLRAGWLLGWLVCLASCYGSDRAI